MDAQGSMLQVSMQQTPGVSPVVRSGYTVDIQGVYLTDYR